MDTGLEDSIRNSPINGERLVLDPETAKKLKSALIEEVDRVVKLGHTPIVLCSREVRWHIKKFTEHILPDLVVLSWDEIPPDVKVESIGEIKL
jgi:flagellar biosynthesis protein FlhA